MLLRWFFACYKNHLDDREAGKNRKNQEDLPAKSTQVEIYHARKIGRSGSEQQGRTGTFVPPSTGLPEDFLERARNVL